MLEEYPTLSALVAQVDGYLQKKHPQFFGAGSSHPILPVRPFKVIHDNLWGTNRFTWRELALIDSPIFQRLRRIHQVGLAFQVYPSAHHTRFEHCLGVLIIASRIFDAVVNRSGLDIRTLAKVISSDDTPEDTMLRLKQELRLAALLHDSGHSLYSHSSELVYQNLGLLKRASAELTEFVGKEKGAGEVLSFCIARSKSVADLLRRAKASVQGDKPSGDYDGEIDLENVALIIVGRSNHPYLQFLGDIVSSGLDADKLDYLLRDATAAGLPLRYDLDRYLHSVHLERGTLADNDGELEKLYASVSALGVERRAPQHPDRYPFYDTYRLRLPKQAMNVIEQIVICKMMLFSYIYHHRKVRASEGMLVSMLERLVNSWLSIGESEEQILERFFDMSDASLYDPVCTQASDEIARDYAYRIANRILPREVYHLSGSDASHADRTLLTVFLTSLQDRAKRVEYINSLEEAIGEELLRLDPSLAAAPSEALAKAGIWVDLPKALKFEDIDELVTSRADTATGVPLRRLFPIGEWTQAYTHYRYYVRIFAFSEYWTIADEASKRAMKRVIGIQNESFYDAVRRSR